MKLLYDNEAVLEGTSSDRAWVAGMESVNVLLDYTSIGGGVFYPHLICQTVDGEIDTEPMFKDGSDDSTWYKYGFAGTPNLFIGIPVTGATWIYFKLVGGTGATGVTLYCDAKEETA